MNKFNRALGSTTTTTRWDPVSQEVSFPANIGYAGSPRIVAVYVVTDGVITKILINRDPSLRLGDNIKR